MDTPIPRAKKIVKGKVGLKETAQLRLAWAPIPQPLGPGQAPHWGPICLSLLLQAPAHAVPQPGTPPPSSPLIQACPFCRPCWAGPPAAGQQAPRRPSAPCAVLPSGLSDWCVVWLSPFACSISGRAAFLHIYREQRLLCLSPIIPVVHLLVRSASLQPGLRPHPLSAGPQRSPRNPKPSSCPVPVSTPQPNWCL